MTALTVIHCLHFHGLSELSMTKYASCQCTQNTGSQVVCDFLLFYILNRQCKSQRKNSILNIILIVMVYYY